MPNAVHKIVVQHLERRAAKQQEDALQVIGVVKEIFQDTERLRAAIADSLEHLEAGGQDQAAAILRQALSD